MPLTVVEHNFNALAASYQIVVVTQTLRICINELRGEMGNTKNWPFNKIYIETKMVMGLYLHIKKTEMTACRSTIGSLSALISMSTFNFKTDYVVSLKIEFSLNIVTFRYYLDVIISEYLFGFEPALI